MKPETRCFVAFGANLGNAAQAHAYAVQAIDALPGTRVGACSSLYRSAPIGVSGHPDYINAVIEVLTRLAADALLEALLAIEHRHGRVRAGAVAPRTLDLDLLLYGHQRITQPGLTVPHPRMHLRAFVLVPLAEIDAAIEIPGRGGLRPLLAGVADQAITRLSPPARRGTTEIALS